jgi:RHS repeat-associated protein
VTDPDGRKVFTDYFKDGKTRQIIKAFESVTMAPIEYVSYTYTPTGQIDTVEDANGNFTNLDYDAFDRLHRTFHANPASGAPCTPTIPHSSSAPSGCVSGQTYEELLYDANGNVTSKRNRSGKTLAFAFDDLNREATRNVPANVNGNFARTLTTSYDLASRKWDVAADGQMLSHRYDAAGRVDYVDDSLLGASNRLDYAYDAADNRTSVVYPGGTTVAYAFDALNRMDTVTEGGVVLADYDWDVLSRRDLVKLRANAFSMDLSYEADDDLASLVHTGPTPVTFSFSRNQSGQITTLTASDGAFLSRPSATQSTPYVPDRLNRYASVGGTAYTWDLNGNLTGDGVYVFEYDEENRLRSAAGSGQNAAYEYDPLGRRRAKTVNGTLTRFVSDNAEEIEERNSGQTVLRSYVYGSGIDERIAMLDTACAGGRCYYLTNWQGSTTTLVNHTGSTLNATYHYGPYGEQVGWAPSDAAAGNPFRYTGRRLDPETGLYYYRARYYSPRLGRFLQTDPLGAVDDLNLYGYVTNDAVNFLEPTGMFKNCSEYQEAGGGACEEVVDDEGNVVGLKLAELPTWDLARSHFKSGDAIDVYVTDSALTLAGVDISDESSVAKALANIGEGKADTVSGTGVAHFHHGSLREAQVIGHANVSYAGNITKLDDYGSFEFEGHMWLSGADVFNFEMHPWSMGAAARNIATKLVDPGEGRSFPIHMVGRKSVSIIHFSHIQDRSK